MTVSFDLDIDDWLAFQEYFKGKRAPLYKWLPTILILLAISLVVFNVIYLFYREASLVNIISLGFLLAIFYMLYLKKKATSHVRKMAAEIKLKHPEAFGIHEITFDGDGIKIKNEHTDVSLEWDDMNTYDENKDYFFLYSKKGVAYIIPKKKIDFPIDELKALFIWQFDTH